MMKRVFFAVLVLTLLASIAAPALAFAGEPLGSAAMADMMPAIVLVASGLLALTGAVIGYLWRQHRMNA
jgi:hypothetical protein